jgi:hypothetical protein
MPGDVRSSSVRFALAVMGANAGPLKSFDGLDMTAEIVTTDTPGGQKKQVANVRWTPAKATIGIAMGKELYAIIQQAFKAQPKRFDGALQIASVDYKVQSSLDFSNAILTAMTFPKCDGSSREPAYFDFEWEAESVRWRKGDNSDIRPAVVPAQKQWLCSNFRFEMGGLPCNRVATIDSFAWNYVLEPAHAGELLKHPGRVTIPNITVDVSMADYDAWAEAARKWFVDGQNEDNDEMSGAIVFLATDMKTELGRVTLRHCGFAEFRRGALEAASDKIARFSCEFYVEEMEFALGPANQ